MTQLTYVFQYTKCIIENILLKIFNMGRWLSGRRRQTVNLLVVPTLVRIQSFSLLKKFRKKHSPLEKVLKLFIRKIETRHGVKKTILLNFTLVNSSKLKNINLIVMDRLDNTCGTSGLSHPQFVNYIKGKHLFFSEKLLETYNKKLLIDVKSDFKKGLSLQKNKLLLHITFSTLNYLLDWGSEGLLDNQTRLAGSLKQTKQPLNPSLRYLRYTLNSQTVYYKNVLYSQQFKLNTFRGLIRGTKKSAEKCLQFLTKFHLPLVSSESSKINLLIKSFDVEELKHRLEKSSLKLKYPSVDADELVTELNFLGGLVYDWYNTNLVNGLAPYDILSQTKPYLENVVLAPVNRNVTKLISLYVTVGVRYKVFTEGLISEEIEKLINPATLILNFRKSRFFPSLTNLKGRLFATMSLGMFSKFFNKGKSFIKNKSVFLLIAGFLRKLILFSEIQGATLLIKRVPLYFKEIVSALHDPVVSFYKNPFTGSIINEADELNTFKFTTFMFINNKPYGKVKNKLKGRLKRKITKRLVSINRMVD